MPRTITHSRTKFFLEGRGGISFPSKASDLAGCPTFVIPPGSKFNTGLHWHETHTEYLIVTQGVALVTLGDKTERFGPQDGIIVIPRYTKHSFGRADGQAWESGDDGKGVELRIREWTDPKDGDKERFFRNMLGVFTDMDPQAGILGKMSTGLQLFVIFNSHDNYPALVQLPSLGGIGRALELGIVHVISFVVSGLGWLAGFRAEYPEYTPEI